MYFLGAEAIYGYQEVYVRVKKTEESIGLVSLSTTSKIVIPFQGDPYKNI